VSVQFS